MSNQTQIENARRAVNAVLHLTTFVNAKAAYASALRHLDGAAQDLELMETRSLLASQDANDVYRATAHEKKIAISLYGKPDDVDLQVLWNAWVVNRAIAEFVSAVCGEEKGYERAIFWANRTDVELPPVL